MKYLSRKKESRISSILKLTFELFIFLLILSFLIVCIIYIPEYQIQFDKVNGRISEDIPRQINEYRKTIAQLIGGIVIAVGLYLTWRRIRATEYAVTISEEVQITDRFSKAVEQLGAIEIAVRLGGIYALERIAKDSKIDHWTVMEILSAYIRNYSPEGEIIIEEYEIPRDIQAALTVIGRRNTIYDPEKSRIDLSKACLVKADLNQANLQRVLLYKSNLERSLIYRADLSGSNLYEANLKEANLSMTNLKGADLKLADLEGAYLQNANLESSRLVQAHLLLSRLEKARLKNADLSEADLKDAKNLNESQLITAGSLCKCKNLSINLESRLKKIKPSLFK